MDSLQVSSIGPINRANIDFGDMTVLVGPQATGKSIFLQLFKLAKDTAAIRQTLKRYGYDWQHDWPMFLSLYFGEGMGALWSSNTEVSVNKKTVDLRAKVYARGPIRPESVFLIPAQRVLTLKGGWPRPFMDFDSGDPFCVRNFSECVRQLMETGLGKGKAVFPQPRRLKKKLRDTLDASIFRNAKLQLDLGMGVRKRLVLNVSQNGQKLPFMVWSAGQREFMPLLLGLYWLMPPAKISRKRGIRWVIIEEPEMGLHPKAILSLVLVLLDLLDRGYRLITSTHSPAVLDIVWAIQELKKARAKPELLGKLFGLKRVGGPLKSVLNTVLNKKVFRTYYFHDTAQGVSVKDISALDPGHEDSTISGWGGLTEFSGHIADVVSEAVGGTL